MDKLSSGVGEIEKGVPMHGHYKVRTIELMTARQTLATMETGDSTTLDNITRLSPFIRAEKRHGFKIAWKRLPGGSYRLWKLADPPKNQLPVLSLDPTREKEPAHRGKKKFRKAAKEAMLKSGELPRKT